MHFDTKHRVNQRGLLQDAVTPTALGCAPKEVPLGYAVEAKKKEGRQKQELS
ncbi:MAG: hypothetical protein KZQ94_03410 [Candidatus Thiodiazotropha sp. (ex Troendleina suluensis)]|nr:hypothetical protein [Candidatus Thiodiazotropha sp. (ex Troendleina suluensis)]